MVALCQGARRTVASGANASKGQHLLLIKGLSSLKGAPAGDSVLIGAPNISKSSIPCRMHRKYTQKKNRYAPHKKTKGPPGGGGSLTGAFIDAASFSETGASHQLARRMVYQEPYDL